MSPHLLIALCASAAMVVLAALAADPRYRVAPLFLIPILFVVYLARRRLNIPPLYFACFAIALLLHDLGSFGWYQASPLPFSYDILVHFYFAFAAGLILFRAIEWNVPALRPWQVYAATFFFIMGFGAIHEIMEYCSWLLLGDRGMLRTNGYIFDTQRDLLNNLLGVSLALVCIGVGRRFRAAASAPAARTESPPPRGPTAPRAAAH
jgi:uncharacterized membrane protein YjdF